MAGACRRFEAARYRQRCQPERKHRVWDPIRDRGPLEGPRWNVVKYTLCMVHSRRGRDHAVCHRSPVEEEPLMIGELEAVVLTCDLPEHGLARGDIGTVVLVHNGGKGYEIEFTPLDGETIAVATLSADQVRPSKPREIAHVRRLAVNP